MGTKKRLIGTDVIGTGDLSANCRDKDLFGFIQPIMTRDFLIEERRIGKALACARDFLNDRP